MRPFSKAAFFDRLLDLVKFAENNIEFYGCYYRGKGFTYKQLKSFDNLSEIPVVTKSDLQEFGFEARVASLASGIAANTGGTSGQPLKLILDNAAYAREWAHMHTIWEQLGYKTSSIKITLRGMNLGDQPIKYNFIHNEFQINAYCEFEQVANALSKVLSKYRIEYVHGYPSGIYELIKQLSADYPMVLLALRLNLKGVFFGSEYPAPVYRDFIEASLNVDTVSWYGHTEMAVLAREKGEPFIYHPFQSYGFAEAVEIDGKCHLVGTTIHNKIGPLIRYDTEDIIEPVSYDDGILESFKISEGRVGEFVVDNNGRNISLTALIFGRHHKLFDSADFIQVKQPAIGELTIYVTSKNQALDCSSLFDAEGINMTIDFQVVAQPFKTKAGKVPLIVN
jgi:phenylacetate-CoA ligase